MAMRVGRYRVGMRGGPVAMVTSIVGIIGLLITAFVGDKVITILKTIIDVNDSASVFYPMYQFLGLTYGSTSSIIGVMGIIFAAVIILGAFKFWRA